MNTLATLGLLAGTAAAETIHGVVVFTRHGDRTTKHYGNQQLTPLGATQNNQVGSSYRARYLNPASDHQIRGMSADEYIHSQVYASAPNQPILSNTATAFLQGLYPPLSDIVEDLASTELNDGTNSTAPLEGYQYVLLQGVDTNSPETIWIKGDDSCPAYTEAAKGFPESDVYQQRVDDTRDFYRGMYKYLEDVYDLTEDDMTYDNAYTIFDLINVARIHNESSSALDVSDDDMLQLRTLADSFEFGENYNESSPDRSIGAKTLAGGVLKQLDETISSEGKLKFSLLSGSYDTFLAFFGVMGLIKVSDNFTGLPDYASTMAFELFTDDDSDVFPAEKDLKIRWMLKNGTEGALTSYPLFGQDEETMAWSEFKDEFDQRAITNVGQWCSTCSATEDFCAAYDEDGERISSGDGSSENKDGGSGGMSNAVAGVIGAVVTLAMVAIVGAIAFVILRRKKASRNAAAMGSATTTERFSDKKSSLSGDSA